MSTNNPTSLTRKVAELERIAIAMRLTKDELGQLIDRLEIHWEDQFLEHEAETITTDSDSGER